jgi:hypothetical protein
MQHIARWLVMVNKVTAVVSENRWSLRGWSGPARVGGGKEWSQWQRSDCNRREFPAMLRPIDLDPLMPSQESSDGHKDVPKSLILAASTGAEKTPVNTVQIFVGDRAGIYRFRSTAFLLDRMRRKARRG